MSRDGGPCKGENAHFDKRTLRKMFADRFIPAIVAWRGSEAPPKPVVPHSEGPRSKHTREALSAVLSTALPTDGPASRVTVFARKRPLFVHESDRGEFDVITATAGSSGPKLGGGGGGGGGGGAATGAAAAGDAAMENRLTVHDCRRAAKGRDLTISHNPFVFDRVFGEGDENSTVYVEAVRPLLSQVLRRGGIATVFMFGQTGSGKTHTMQAMYRYIAGDILRPGRLDPSLKVVVSCIEVAGSLSRDLLESGKRVAIREDGEGTTKTRGAVQHPVASYEDLCKLLAIAKRSRATDATGKNTISSRSHMVTTLSLQREEMAPSGSADDETRGMGEPESMDDARWIDPATGERLEYVPPTPRPTIVTVAAMKLVDLAGSERKEDSDVHNAAQRRECIEINKSLAALKDCMRASAAMDRKGKARGPKSGAASAMCAWSKAVPVRIPYRASTLTRVLKECFCSEDALVAMIATVSPSSSDTEHSINTLAHASLMRKDGYTPEVTTSTMRVHAYGAKPRGKTSAPPPRATAPPGSSSPPGSSAAVSGPHRTTPPAPPSAAATPSGHPDECHPRMWSKSQVRLWLHKQLELQQRRSDASKSLTKFADMTGVDLARLSKATWTSTVGDSRLGAALFIAYRASLKTFETNERRAKLARAAEAEAAKPKVTKSAYTASGRRLKAGKTAPSGPSRAPSTRSSRGSLGRKV